MERPKIKNYQDISGTGAFYYIRDVNKYINYVESLSRSSLDILKKLIENGDFFISAIELDSNNSDIDGEEIKKEIEALLKDANIEYDLP